MKFLLVFGSATIVVLSGVLHATPAAQQTIGRQVTRMIYTADAKAGGIDALRDTLKNKITTSSLPVKEIQRRSTVAESIHDLFDLNADLEDEGMSPLGLAIKLRKPKAMKLLIEAGAGIDVLGKRGISPFGEIIATGQLDAALMVAVELEDAALVERLIDAGANVNNTDSYATSADILSSDRIFTKLGDITPILLAAKTGNIHIMKLLHNKGADIYHKNSHGDGIFEYLLTKGDTEAYAWAHSKGIMPNKIVSVIKKAVFENKVHVVRELLDGGHLDDDNMGFALSVAASKSSSNELLSILLAHSENPNYQDSDGITPLMVHVLDDWSGKNIETLFRKDVDPTLQDNNGNTVLHLAAHMARGKDVFEPLLSRDNVADFINIKANNGLTALDVAQGNFLAEISRGGNFYHPKGTNINPSAQELLRAAGAKTAAELAAE